MELVKNFKKNFDNSIYNETFVGDFDSKIELPLVYESDLSEVKELIEKVFSDKKMNPKYNVVFKDDEGDELVVYCNSNIKDDLIKTFKKIGIYGEPITEFEEEVSEVEKEDDLIKAKDIKIDKDGEIKLDKDTTMIIEDGEGGCDAGGSVGMTTADVAGYDAPFEIPTEYTKKQKKMMRRGQLESKKVVKEAVQIPSSAKRKGQNLIKGIEELYRISETKPNDWLQMYDENDWSFYIKDYKFNDKNMTFTWKERNDSTRADNNVYNQKEKFVANGEFDFYGEFNDFVNYWNKLVRKTKKYLEMDSTELDKKLGYDVDEEIEESKKIVKEDADWSPEDDRREREAEEDWDSGKTQSSMGLVDSPEGIPGKYYWIGGHWKEWDEGDDDDYRPRRKQYPKYTKKGTGMMSEPKAGYKRLILSDWFFKKLEEKYNGKDNLYLFGKEDNDIIISEIKQKTKNAILVKINFGKVDKEDGNWYVSAISENVWIPLSQIKSIEKDIPKNSSDFYDPETGISLKGYKPEEIKESKRTIKESTMEEDLFDSFRDTIESDTFTVKDLRTYIRDLVDTPDIEALNDLAKETIEDWTEYNLVKKVDSNTYKFMD